MGKGCLFPSHAVPALFQGLSISWGHCGLFPAPLGCVYPSHTHVQSSAGEPGGLWQGWLCIPRLSGALVSWIWRFGFVDLQHSAGTAPALNGLFVLGSSSCLFGALLIVLPQPTLGLGALRASSGFAYGSQQQFCHCPWRFLMKGSEVVVPCAPLTLSRSTDIKWGS